MSEISEVLTELTAEPHLNGEIKGPQENEGPTEVLIPDATSRLIIAASQIANAAIMQIELAQARAEAARKSYDALLFKTAAQLRVDPDEFRLDARDNQLLFVRVPK